MLPNRHVNYFFAIIVVFYIYYTTNLLKTLLFKNFYLNKNPCVLHHRSRAKKNYIEYRGLGNPLLIAFIILNLISSLNNFLYISSVTF